MHTHTCSYMLTRAHTCSYRLTRAHTRSYMFIHVHTCSYMLILVHTGSYMLIHSLTCSYMRSYVLSCIHAHVHTCSLVFISNSNEWRASNQRANSCDRREIGIIGKTKHDYRPKFSESMSRESIHKIPKSSIRQNIKCEGDRFGSDK